MNKEQRIGIAAVGTVAIATFFYFNISSSSSTTSASAKIPEEFDRVPAAKDPFLAMRNGADSLATLPIAATPTAVEEGKAASPVAEPQKPVALASPSPVPFSECSVTDDAAGRCTRNTEIETKKELPPVPQPPSNFPPVTTKAESQPGIKKEEFLVMVADRDKMPPPPAGNERDESRGSARAVSSEESNDPLDLMAKVATHKIVEGRKIAMSGRQIKNGCRVLALVDDSFSLVAGEPSPTTLTVFGVLSGCGNGFPDGVKLVGEASANKNETRIHVKITACSDQKSSNQTLPCVGIAKDLQKGDGLRADIYSKAGWSIVTGAASTFLAGIALEKMTTSVTEKGAMVDATQSNRVLQAFANAIVSTGEELKKGFDKAGTVLEVEKRSFVQVLFTEDAGPW